MAGDDLLAHRQADAGASGLGRSLIELVFDEGQLLLGHAGAIVPDAHHHLRPLLGHGHVDALARAAVLGGVVQQIAEHLAQPLRVAGDGQHLLRAVLIAQLDALPAEELLIGIDRVLHLGLQVQGLHRQGEAPVLDAGELQQLLHHVGQAVGL